MALKQGLALKIPGILGLVSEHNLFVHLGEVALDIMTYDLETIGHDLDLLSNADGLKLLLENKGKVPMELIVESIREKPLFLHLYLDAIFQKDSMLAAPFHDMQVQLYAKYDTSKLLEFLKISLNYSIPEAYEICEQLDLVPEMVYLLGKMGNSRKALMLLIERVADVKGVS